MRLFMKALLDKLKNILLDRPLGCSCGALMVLTALLLFSPALFKIALILCGIVFFIFFLILRKRAVRIRFLATLMAVISLLCTLSGACTLLSYDLFDKNIQQAAQTSSTVELVGYPIKTVYESDFSNCMIFQVNQMDEKRVWDVQILAYFSPDDTPALFQYTTLRGPLEEIETSDPSFDSAGYYQAKGIFAQSSASEVSVSDEIASDPRRVLHTVQKALTDRIDDQADELSAGLIKGFLLGDKSGLDTEFKRDFKTMGLSHTLAVSGLHLSILVAFWTALLLKLRVPLKVRAVLLVLFTWIFAALCAFSLSVVRSAIMLSMLMLSKLVSADNDSKTSLLLSGGLIVLLSPYSIFDVGFLLSFFSTFGILSVMPLLRKKKEDSKTKMMAVKKALRALVYSIAVTLSAQIAVLPVMYHSFGSVSVLSPLFNLLFTPILSLFLYLSPLALILSFLPVIGPLLFDILGILSHITVWLSSHALYFKDSLVYIGSPVILPLLILLCGAVLAFLLSREHKKRIGCVVLALYGCFCSVCILLPYLHEPQVFTDTNGKNDIILLQDGTQSMIIDLSDGSKSNLRYTITKLAEESGDLTPDALFITHYHQRHLSSFNALCAEHYPKHLYLTAPQNESEEAICQSLIALATEQKVQVHMLKEGETLRFGSLVIADFVRTYLKRSTHPVLSFSLQTPRERFTYLSSSSLEAGVEVDDYTVYLGVHGPIVKQSLSARFISTHKLRFAHSSLLEGYGIKPPLPNNESSSLDD